MRYLGIDYGSKRVGVAVSDELKTFATPLVVFSNIKDLISEISKICREKEIELIVVGESKDFAQVENKIMEEIKPFVKNLEDELKISVHMHPEFMTSQEAQQLQGKNEMNDASAAALILKSYLDTTNVPNKTEQQE